MLIEGCGGIICPFRMDVERVMLEDIIKLIGSDIVIVASAELGTINSTVLTVEYARLKGIGIKGIIGSMSETSSLTENSYTYTGGAGRIYLYSAGSGINLYQISVEY